MFGTVRSVAEEIKIAVCGPFTGSDPEIGRMLQRGLRLKLKEINAQGHNIKLVYKDDSGKAAKARIIAQEVAQDPSIVAVIGHVHSDCSLAAREVYAKAKIVALSPGSTHASLCAGSPYYFRNIFRNDDQGRFAAQYIDEILRLKKVAVIADNSAYGQDLRRHFVNEAKKRKCEVVSEELYDSAITQDFNSVVRKYKFTKPDIVFVAGLYKHGALLAQAMKRSGIKIRIIGGDGLHSKQFITQGADEVEGALVVVPFVEDKAFDKAYAENYYGDHPSALAALSYDALGLLAHVLTEVGPNRETLREKMAQINSLQTGYKGLAGITYFDANGDCLRPAVLAEVKGAVFVKASRQLHFDTSLVAVGEPEVKIKKTDENSQKISDPKEEALLADTTAEDPPSTVNEILIAIIIVLALVIMVLVVRKPAR